MSDAKKQERRRRVLKERRAAQSRVFDREEARYLCELALEMDEAGDASGAAKSAKKALHLDPDCYPALDLLARIHFAAEQFEQAISYLQLLRKNPEAVSVGYNLGQSNLALGRTEEALKDFREFLDATRALKGPLSPCASASASTCSASTAGFIVRIAPGSFAVSASPDANARPPRQEPLSG